MNAENEVRRTLAQYAQVHDGEDVDGFVALFTENGRLSVRGQAQPVGRAAIKAFLVESFARRHAESKRAKHLYASSVVEIDGERASATTDWVAYQAIGTGPWEVNRLGRCIDQLVHQNGEWLFEERQIVDARTSA